MDTKKKNKKHLEFYYKCMETGKLPSGDGLCSEAVTHTRRISAYFLDTISPYGLRRDKKSVYYYFNSWADIWSGVHRQYWGSGKKYPLKGQFTPLRQTIVLLMAAMNNEL